MEASTNGHSNGALSIGKQTITIFVMRFISLFSFFVITISSSATQKPNSTAIIYVAQRGTPLS